jgi:hypothetical protein
MKAFGAALLVLGLVIVAPYLPGILHMFVGEPRPPDNLSLAPVFLGVALIGIGAIVLVVRPSAKHDEEEDEDRVECPFCAERIEAEAILCPHCGSIAATPPSRLARRDGPIRSDAKALLDSLFFRIEEERSIGPSSRDAAKKILEWLDGMDPDRRHRDFITKELRWWVTGPDRIADMDYSVHEALLDLLERSNSATTKRPRAS